MQDFEKMEHKLYVQEMMQDRQDKIQSRSLELIQDKYMSLSRELVLMDGWCWLPGMMAVRWNPNGLYHGRREVRVEGEREIRIVSKWECVPDLQDAATLGAILKLVRELWKDQRICNIFDSDDGTWCCGIWNDGLVLRGKSASTEAESLLNCIRNYNISCHPDKGGYTTVGE